MGTVGFKSWSLRQVGDRVATAGNNAEHLHLTVDSLLSWGANTMRIILLTVIYIILAVFILHGMCPWIPSWRNVELRHNYHEGKGGR